MTKKKTQQGTSRVTPAKHRDASREPLGGETSGKKSAAAKQGRGTPKARRNGQLTDAELARMSTEELTLLAYRMTYDRVHGKRKVG